MRTAAQRALFKQNSARAVQAAGLARHRSQPRENINAGDATMVWRNNNLTGRNGWTGPGVVVAVSPTKKTLATELLKSRQRSGQRGYVDVEVERRPPEEPPADTRPDVSQILEAVVPTPNVLTPIPEESVPMDTALPEVAESGPEIRPRQPESGPGSEPLTGMSDLDWRPIRK